ncbi:MAG TPA: c-type cytochrome [Cyclobacteriaceae bacterium]|nr:c-type cytochrome [Cyclobacteriaceae bacterium]
MKLVSFTWTRKITLLQIIFLFGILPPVNVGAEERVMESNFVAAAQPHTVAVEEGVHEGNFPQQQPSPEQGKELFAKKGCVACHDTDGETKGKLGPRMKGVMGSVRNFEDGKSVVADEDYIRQSILAPTEKVVKGYQPVMPPYGSILTTDEVASVVLYIKSL